MDFRRFDLTPPLPRLHRRSPEHLGRINHRARSGDTDSTASKCRRQNTAAMSVAVEPALDREGGEGLRIVDPAGGIEIAHDVFAHRARPRVTVADLLDHRIMSRAVVMLKRRAPRHVL